MSEPDGHLCEGNVPSKSVCVSYLCVKLFCVCFCQLLLMLQLFVGCVRCLLVFDVVRGCFAAFFFRLCLLGWHVSCVLVCCCFCGGFLLSVCCCFLVFGVLFVGRPRELVDEMSAPIGPGLVASDCTAQGEHTRVWVWGSRSLEQGEVRQSGGLRMRANGHVRLCPRSR